MKRIALAATMLIVSAAAAQEFRASLTGRVTDSSGAVIPKASVVVKNTDTGVQVHIQTDKAGSYTAPFLLPGTYSIEVTAPGFTSYLHDGITLLTAQKIEEDATLKIGSASEEVHVTMDAPLVDATTASVAQVLTAEDIEDLPDNGRSPLGLAKTELGVVPKAKNSVVQTRPFDNGATSDFSIGGGNSQSNEYLLNGVPNMQDSSRVPGFSPQLDSVEAVRVDVFSSDASLGDTSGGTVNLTTKPGTNAYHGTASEFNQFSAINAPQRWFVPATSKTPATRQNQYGVTFGGPVRIPHLFNGRDKLFFFYSFERFKDSTPNPITSTVPTVAERGGDFSSLLNLGSTYQLYDPNTAVATVKGTSTTIARTAFASNMINPNRFNPVAKAYLQFIPLPNLPGSADGENNFFSNVATIDDYGSHSGRIDYSISDRNKLFGEVHRSEYFRTLGNVFANLSTGTTTYTVHQGGLLDFIHTFSPTTTLDTRASLTRTYSNSSLSSQGFDATSLGFPGYLQTNSTEPILPRIIFSEASGTVAFNSLSTTAGTVSAFDTFQIFGALTKVAGHHTLKFGPDLRLEKYAKLTPGSPSGAFTFGQNFVQSGTGGVTIPFGGSFAEFLLGLPTSGTQTIATPNLYNAFYFAGFAQDDWRILPSLTLNFGLRIEHETPITESGNRAVVGFDPTLINSATAGASAKYASIYNATTTPELPVANFNAKGGLIFATPGHRNEYNTANVYISPRFGFAFAPPMFHGNTAIRGGFGVFVNPFNDYNTPQTYGYSATSTLVPTTNSYLTPAATLSDPFPTTNPILQPTGNGLGINTNLGAGIQFRGPNLQVPYAERWSLDIQQQLTRNIMLDVGYIGSHQVHLSYSNSLSAAGDLPYLSTNRRADPNVPTSQYNTTTNPCGVTPTKNLQCNITNPFLGQPNVTGAIGTGATITKYQLLGNFPEYSGVTQALVSGASATYNELLARLHFRNRFGLNFNANYEYSKNLITGQLTPGGPLSYQESTSDYPNHFSFEGGYTIPIGRGQKFFNSNGLISQLIGGFKMNAIYQFLSGTPIQWGSVDFANGTSGFKQDFQSQPRNFTHAFNTAAFYQGTGAGYAACFTPKAGVTCDYTDTGQPSTTYNVRTFPQYFLRTDPTNNLDASIIKSFTVGERIKLEYRFEAFNVLNHTQFGTPFVAPSASTFGTINTIASVNRTLQQGLRVSF